MSPSLPSLPTAAVTPELLPAASSNININQSDRINSGGFGAFLGEAYSAISSAVPGAAAAPPEGGTRLAELQPLPQDGKLLPLLQQALEKLAGAGVDLKQFAERLASKLKTLSQDSATGPEQQLAVALQQLLQEQPALKSILPADTLAAIAQSAQSKSRLLVADGSNASAMDRPELAQQKTGDTAARLPPPSGQAVSTDRGALTLDTALSQLQQPIAAQEQPPADTAALFAAFKRLLASDKASVPSESATRADIALSGVGAPTATATSASTPGVPSITVATAFGETDWDQALGERIQWLVGQKMQGAQVKLNPANLGPLEVRIQMQNDQASIQFTAHHAVVREALEAALPRLREMLEASGVQLVDVDVSGQQSFAGRQHGAHDPDRPYLAHGFDDNQTDLEVRVQTPLSAFDRRGRLDLFA